MLAELLTTEWLNDLTLSSSAKIKCFRTPAPWINCTKEAYIFTACYMTICKRNYTSDTCINHLNTMTRLTFVLIIFQYIFNPF